MKIISLDKGCFAFIFGLLLWCTHMDAHNRYAPRHAAFWQSAASGTVSDNTGPLPGVSIYNTTKGQGTISDDRGKYSIVAAIGDTLVFSFTGYKNHRQVVAGNTIDILLLEDTAQLEEVVINAGYYSVKDKERTGSIARITTKDIEHQPVTNALATMQGRMAGVNVTQTTGVPGGGFDIVIRGQNSLRPDGNYPLFIIDGVPYDPAPIGSSYTSSTTPLPTSPLNSINPSDIASIEVLKDADATAIYGSRGANGVVLVTTKKGKTGKTSFTGSLSSGFGRVTRFLDLMNTQQYLEMRREAYANDGVTEYPADAYDVNGAWNQDRYTDWQKELTGGTASFTTAQGSLSGGNEQTRFLLSGNYNKETTVFPGDFRYNKANVLANISQGGANDRLKVNFSASYTFQDNYLPPVDFTREAIKLAPNAPDLYDAGGHLNWENNTFTNPLASLEGDFTANTYDLIANTVIMYDILEGFQAKVAAGYTDLRHTEKQTLPSSMYNPSYGYGSEISSVYVNRVDRSSWIIEPQLSYRKDLEKFGFEVLVGTTYQKRDDNKLVQRGYGFSSNSLIGDPAAANTYAVMDGFSSVYKYQALFGRININFGKRYFLNLTGRRDGSSRFGPDNRFANFGAIGGAWLFSSEQWIRENLPFLSLGKLRASYGITGNDQIGDYQYLNTYSSSGSHYGGVSGLQPSRLFNPDFGWENNKKLEIAAETGFFNDRLNLAFSWFRNRSSSQLVGIPLPGTTGFTEIQANLDATVENKGVEITLMADIIKAKGFRWSSSINFSRLRNKLLSFPGLQGSPYKYQYEIGKPLNIVKAYHFTGVDPQTGIYQFEDVDGDGIISSGGDKQKSIDLNPDFFGGFQNEFVLGPVRLDFLLQFVKQENFNQSFSGMMPGTMVNQPVDVLERWQNPGDQSPYQQFSSGANFPALIANTRYMQSDAGISDASYIRLKNISLSYDIPQQWTGNAKCRVSVQAQNLLTFTSYKGADPEFKVAGVLPPLKMFTTNLTFTF
ncbi:SusC/RagA family TonB-linked outer membrane protein [Flavobacterium sp. RHBU_24]|uniref:SusC/RagA family TonB-linked outer membrane protein n=1 Tax=Flavobacterium sp. RHBU_24 TaxID=3391185 RepID=UPI00398517F8